MLQHFKAENRLDQNGNPVGGSVEGKGLLISWQDGPLGQHLRDCATGNRPVVEACECHDRGGLKKPNGAFVETVIAAVVQRIRHYNSGKFSCRENALAITHLEEALHWLNARTRRREEAGVEGTHAEEPKA